MAVPTYQRRVPYSGLVPEQGAQQAAWSATQAGVGLGSAITDAGRGLQRFGAKLEAKEKQRQEDFRQEQVRESQVNMILGATELKKKTLKFASELPQRSWVEDGHGNWSAAIPEYDNMMGPWIESYAEGLHEEHRDLWKARQYADLENDREFIRGKQAEGREQYLREVIPAFIVRLGRGGNLLAAEDWEREFEPLIADAAPDEYKSLQALMREQIILGVALVDEDRAEELSDKWIPKDQRGEFSAKLQADVNAGRTLEQRRRERQVRQNEWQTSSEMIDTLLGIAEPHRVLKPSAVAERVRQGVISPSVGEHIISQLEKPKEPTQAEARASSGAIARTYKRYRDGEVDLKFMESVLWAHQENLTFERSSMWMDRIYSPEPDEKDPYKTVRLDAERMAEKAFGLLYPSGAAEEAETGVPNLLASDTAVGTVMDRLEDAVQDAQKAGRALDGTMYRREANRITGEVYQEELQKKNQDKAKGPTVRERAQAIAKQWEKMGQPVGSMFGGTRLPAQAGAEAVAILPEPPEPQGPNDFIAEVRRLNALSPAEARRYYEKWKDKWQLKP